MKRYLLFVVSFVFVIALMQNCGGFHVLDSVGISAQSENIYPYYASAPEYFADVQFIAKEYSGSEYNYRFIASAVSIQNEDDFIQVEIGVFDVDGNLICPRIVREVNRSNNHIEIEDCSSDQEYLSLVVKVFAGPIDGDLLVARDQYFQGL